MSVRIDVRFRWARTISTRVDVIYLRAPFLKPFPVPLHWNKILELYESKEVSATVGTHLAEIVIDERIYQLDAFEVSSYTFEVELVIVDDRDFGATGENKSSKSLKSTRIPRSRHRTRSSTDSLTNGSQLSSRRTSPRDVTVEAGRPGSTGSQSAFHTPDMSDSSIKRSNLYADLVRQQLNGDRDNDAALIKSERSVHSYRSERSLITDTFQSEGDKLYNGQDLRGHFSNQSSRAPSTNGDGRYSNPPTPQGSHQGSRPVSVHEEVSRAGSARLEEHLSQGSRGGSVHSNEHFSNQGSRAPSIVDDRHSNQGSRPPSVHDDRLSNQGSRAPSIADDRHSTQGSRAPSVRDDRLSNQGSRAPSVHEDRYSNQGSRAPSVHESRNSNQGSRPPSTHEDHYSNQGSRAPSVHEDRLSNQGSRASSVNGDIHSNRGSRVGSAVDDRLTNGGSRGGSVRDGYNGDQGSIGGNVRNDDPHSRASSRPPSAGSNRPPSAGSSHTLGSNRPPSAGSNRPPSSIPASARSVESARPPPGTPGGSRPGSIASSERELSQFFDAADVRQNPHRQSPQTFTDQLPNEMRHSGTASLPVLSQQRSQAADRRSYTPDTYTRNLGYNQPKVSSPLVTSRTLPVSRSSSQAPTPVITNGAAPGEEDDTVATYKKLLADRDVESRSLHQEIEQLRQQNRVLTESGTARFTNKQDYERNYDDLLKEKENLATEVWKLMQEIENFKQNGGSSAPAGDGLNTFSRNSPNILQRKIEDLDSQIQDLQEANETAVADIANLEKINRDLQEENESLKTANSLNLEDLQNENQRLRDQIDQMNEQHTKILLDDDGHQDVMQLRSDIQQMRIDLRALRDKNHHFNEENIRLRDENHDLKRGGKDGSKGSGRLPDVQGSGERMDMIDRIEQYRKDKNAALDEVRSLKDQLYEVKRDKSKTSPPIYSDHVTSYLEQQESYFTPPEDRLTAKYRTPKWDDPQPYTERSASPVDSDHSDSTTFLMTGFQRAPVIGNNYDSELLDVIEEESSPRESTKGSRKYAPYDDDIVSLSTTTTELLQPNNKYASLPNLLAPRLHDELGLLSDTNNTDLANIQYYDRNIAGSISESSSVSSIMDNLEEVTLVGDSEHNGPLRSHRSGSPLSPRAAGFRSVSPPLTVTQHNKGDIGTGRELLSTVGKRPFAPRTPADINLGDVVKFTNKNGRISRGTVKYVGHLPGRNESYLGVELEYSEGKHDGVYMGQRYFKCKPNKGVFVAFNKIVMVWGR